MKQTIIIRGPLGVGKTTIARGVAEEIGGVHLSVGEILKENNLDVIGEKHIPLENYLKANDIILEKLANVKDKPIVIDGNFYYRRQLRDLKKRMGYPFIVFTLDASLDTCLKRDAFRENPQGKEKAMVMHNLVSRYKTGIIVDTEEKDQGEVLDEVLERLKREMEKSGFSKWIQRVLGT